MSYLIYHMNEIQDEVSKILKVTVEICEKNNITYYCQCGTVLGAIRHQGPIPWDYDADIAIPSNEMNHFVACCQKELPEEYWINYNTVYTKDQALFPRIGKKGCSTSCLHLDVFHLIGLPDNREMQLDLITEATEYCRLSMAYVHRYHLRSGLRLGIHTFIDRLKALVVNDTSFVGHMDNLCHRYPYETSNYVMIPFGPYGEKNIFRKEVFGKGSVVPYLNFNVRIPEQWDFYLKQYYGDYMQYPPKNEIDAALNHTFRVEQIKA